VGLMRQTQGAARVVAGVGHSRAVAAGSAMAPPGVCGVQHGACLAPWYQVVELAWAHNQGWSWYN